LALEGRELYVRVIVGSVYLVSEDTSFINPDRAYSGSRIVLVRRDYSVVLPYEGRTIINPVAFIEDILRESWFGRGAGPSYYTFIDTSVRSGRYDVVSYRVSCISRPGRVSTVRVYEASNRIYIYLWIAIRLRVERNVR